MKTLLLTLAATQILLPLSAWADNVSKSYDQESYAARQCYDRCMPERAAIGPALTLNDFMNNNNFCKSQCANQSTENSTTKLTADNNR